MTQMYFAGEPLNDTDRFLATAGRNRERLIVPFVSGATTDKAGRSEGNWEIVLDEG